MDVLWNSRAGLRKAGDQQLVLLSSSRPYSLMFLSLPSRLSDFSPSFLSLATSLHTCALTFSHGLLLLLKYPQDAPASGPLHLLLPLPGRLSPQRFTGLPHFIRTSWATCLTRHSLHHTPCHYTPLFFLTALEKHDKNQKDLLVYLFSICFPPTLEWKLHVSEKCYVPYCIARTRSIRVDAL